MHWKWQTMEWINDRGLYSGDFYSRWPQFATPISPSNTQNSSCHFLSSISEMKNIKLKESTDCLGLNCSFKEKSSLSAKKSSDRTQLFWFLSYQAFYHSILTCDLLHYCTHTHRRTIFSPTLDFLHNHYYPNTNLV